MCMFKAPKAPPPPAQMQSMQTPKDMVSGSDSQRRLRRRGLFASIFTSPQGITTAPMVTGTGASPTGG
jgi:hypothetical protein